AGLAVLLPPSRMSWVNSALPSRPIPSPACSMTWAIPCGLIKSRSLPVRVPTAIFSSNISPSCATDSSAVICPSSAWTAKNASSSVISKILDVVGNLPHVASMITTSAPIPSGSLFLMGWDLRCYGKSRGSGGRRFPRYLRLCRSCHCSLVAPGRFHPLSRFPPTAHSGRYRRQQQLPLSCLENRAPVPTGQLLCPGRDRCPLSHRRFQVESHRASPLLRGLTQLGGRTAGLLPEVPQLCSHHPNPNRTSGHCLSRPPILSLRSQTHIRSNCLTSSAPSRISARMEL